MEKKRAGAPMKPADEKRVGISISIPKRVIGLVDQMIGSRSRLIEAAIISVYGAEQKSAAVDAAGAPTETEN